MRKTSTTGHIRLSSNPNLRSQDGEKRNWLCHECEGVLSGYETKFATNVFHPYVSGNAESGIKYEQWLEKFCTSVSWRTLEYFREKDVFTDYPPELRELVGQAAATWKAFLLGQDATLGIFEQHLLPLDPIEDFTFGELPKNINRYLLRALHMDVIRGGKTAFTYSKLCRFVIIGFIQMDPSQPWVGTKVNPDGGFIGPRDYTVPEQFGDYLISKANETAQIQNKLSDNQIKKVNESFLKNLHRMASTDAFQALHHDVRLFGEAAFDGGDKDHEIEK